MSDLALPELRDARRHFLDLVRDLRPQLHRYCARMTGSVVDAEDVVQDTLAHAYFALSELEQAPVLRPWLFRIAHNRAVDFLRRYDRRMGDPLDEVADAATSPPAALDERAAARAALAAFLRLPASQRACVILKDVLGHSSQEIAATLDLGVPAVDACLHRGRARLRAIGQGAARPPRPPSPTVEKYAALFQARDWDGVRALLTEDVQVDLVGHARRAGAAAGKYFTNYATAAYRAAPGSLEDREGMYLFADHRDTVPAYFIELVVADAMVVAIRDYRYVPYLLADVG